MRENHHFGVDPHPSPCRNNFSSSFILHATLKVNFFKLLYLKIGLSRCDSKTKTKKKYIEDPTNAIFSKSRRFKDIKYDILISQRPYPATPQTTLTTATTSTTPNMLVPPTSLTLLNLYSSLRNPLYESAPGLCFGRGDDCWPLEEWRLLLGEVWAMNQGSSLEGQGEQRRWKSHTYPRTIFSAAVFRI